jgi:hypothetical protein
MRSRCSGSTIAGHATLVLANYAGVKGIKEMLDRSQYDRPYTTLEVETGLHLRVVQPVLLAEHALRGHAFSSYIWIRDRNLDTEEWFASKRREDIILEPKSAKAPKSHLFRKKSQVQFAKLTS